MFIKKIKQYRTIGILAISALAIFFTFGVCYAQENNVVLNGLGGTIAVVIGWLANIIIAVLGWLLSMFLKLLVGVATFNNIIDVPAVQNGWIIIRDLCNMFFVLIFLIIAFGTILQIESYNAKKLLPKLLIIAVVINFSKVIFGILIDLSQIVMLTFVNGFAQNGAGNFIAAFKTDTITNFGEKVDANNWALAVGAIAGVLALIVTFVVVGVMCAILVMRVVMLWIYTIMSPLVFLGMAFDPMKKYVQRIWEDFVKQLIVGPVLAFFIWLALATASDSSNKMGTSYADGTCSGFVNSFFCEGNFQTFVITIGLLFGGLMVAQEMGGAAGGIAGKGLGMAKGLVKGVAGSPWKYGKKAVGKGVDIGISAASRSDAIKNTLGKIGGKNIPIVATLATAGLVGLGANQRAQEEKAQKFVGNINDTRILARIANQGGISNLTPYAKAMKEAARDRAPSSIIADKNDPSNIKANAGEVLKQLNQMPEEKLSKVSGPAWADVGKLFEAAKLDLSGQALTFIQKNTEKRGAFNLGRKNVNANAALTIGTNSTGDDLDNLWKYGNMPGETVVYKDKKGNDITKTIPSDKNLVEKILRQGANLYNYRKVAPDETQERGAGNLSVGEFGLGKSNTLAVDFDQLGVDSLKENKREEFKDIKGVNVTDSGTIKQIADKMVGVLDNEIAKLKAGGAKGDDQRLKNLEQAKQRFQDPNQLDNISLVNSSSRGYTLSDLKKTKIHEELHGFGIKNEAETEQLTQHAIETRGYSKVKDMAKSRMSVDQVINSEKSEEEELSNDTEVQSASSNPQTGPVIKQIVSDSGSSILNAALLRRIAYGITSLNKAVNKQAGSLGKLGTELSGITNINPEKATSLEISLAADKIKRML